MPIVIQNPGSPRQFALERLLSRIPRLVGSPEGWARLCDRVRDHCCLVRFRSFVRAERAMWLAGTDHIGDELFCGSENHRIEDCLRRSEQDNQDGERLVSSQDLSAMS